MRICELVLLAGVGGAGHKLCQINNDAVYHILESNGQCHQKQDERKDESGGAGNGPGAQWCPGRNGLQ